MNKLNSEPVNKHGAWVTTAAVIFLLAICFTIYSSIQLNEVDRWTLHTHNVIEELQRAFSSLQDVETGERGFLITGDESFLAPFNRGKDEIQKHFSSLDSLLNGNDEQSASLNVLKQIGSDKILHASSTVKTKREGKAEGPAFIHAVDGGKEIMDKFRNQMNSMQETEEHVLERRVESLKQSQSIIWIGIGILACSSLGIFLTVIRISRSAAMSEQLRAESLTTMNKSLESEIQRRIKIEKDLQDTTSKLQISNTDLNQFAYVASHDLQEPLRAVAGFLSLLERKHKDTLDDESKRWIKHSVDGATRMKTLINGLLAFSRIDSRGQQFADVDCNKILDRVRQDLSVALEESRVNLIVENLPTIKADATQLSQVFQNLISNAIKFRTAENPEIRVSSSKEAENWQFVVKDNGIGFDIEHAERIFVLFQRLQTRDKYEGSGIGLALCKKIVERHGGDIWAKAELEHGAEFIFTIPIGGTQAA